MQAPMKLFAHLVNADLWICVMWPCMANRRSIHHDKKWPQAVSHKVTLCRCYRHLLSSYTRIVLSLPYKNPSSLSLNCTIVCPPGINLPWLWMCIYQGSKLGAVVFIPVSPYQIHVADKRNWLWLWKSFSMFMHKNTCRPRKDLAIWEKDDSLCFSRVPFSPKRKMF